MSLLKHLCRSARTREYFLLSRALTHSYLILLLTSSQLGPRGSVLYRVPQVILIAAKAENRCST